MELEAPDSLAGCLIRCTECDGALRAPTLHQVPRAIDWEDGKPVELESQEAKKKPEESKPAGANPSPQHPWQRPEEIQEYVAGLMERARKEQEQKPYLRTHIPIDLIVGGLFIGGGMLLFWRALTSGDGMMAMLIYGILLPFVLILIGAGCILLRNK